MRNFVRNGYLLDYPNTSGSTIPSGSTVVLVAGNAGMIGIAEDDIPDQTVGAVRIAGVNWLNALSTDTGSIGTKFYWDAVAGRATTTPTNNTPAGWLAEAKANGDTAVKLMLNGLPGGAR